MHFDVTASLRYAVGLRGAVVVVVIVFERLCQELVLPSGDKDRMTEQITDRAVCVFGVHRNIFAVAAQFGNGHARLSVTLLLHAVQQLGELYLHGRTVDAVIDCRKGIQGCTGEVEGLRTNAGREEGGIASGGSLHHFVFDREQIHRIFAGRGIRLDGDTFLLEERMGSFDALMHRVTR